MTRIVPSRVSPVERRDVSVDVGDLVGAEGVVEMRGVVALPGNHRDVDDGRALVYALVGGGAQIASLDLDVPGRPGYSLLEFLVEAGMTFVAFDHPSVGASDAAPDAFELDAELVAECHERALGAVVTSLGRAPTAAIGLGHSMGAMIIAHLQDRTRPFDAVALLGFDDRGLPEVLTADERALALVAPEGRRARTIELARQRFAPGSDVPKRMPSEGVFHGEGVDPEVRSAYAGLVGPVLPTCAIEAMVPGLVDEVLGRLDVPVFVGVGERDIVHAPRASVAAYQRVNDLELYVLPGAGHVHDAAPNRRAMWSRLVRFARRIADEVATTGVSSC